MAQRRKGVVACVMRLLCASLEDNRRLARLVSSKHTAAFNPDSVPAHLAPFSDRSSCITQAQD